MKPMHQIKEEWHQNASSARYILHTRFAFKTGSNKQGYWGKGENKSIQCCPLHECMCHCLGHFCTSGKYDLLTNGEIKKNKMYVCKHESCVLATVPPLNSN